MQSNIGDMSQKVTKIKFIQSDIFQGLVMSNSLGYLSFHSDLKYLDQIEFYGFSTSNSPIQNFDVIDS